MARQNRMGLFSSAQRPIDISKAEGDLVGRLSEACILHSTIFLFSDGSKRSRNRTKMQTTKRARML